MVGMPPSIGICDYNHVRPHSGTRGKERKMMVSRMGCERRRLPGWFWIGMGARSSNTERLQLGPVRLLMVHAPDKCQCISTGSTEPFSNTLVLAPTASVASILPN